MNELLLVAVLSANPLFTVPVDNGSKIELYDDSADCDFGWDSGVVRNSAKLVTMDFCWRLNRSTGEFIFSNGRKSNVEEFNSTDEGTAWLRRELL